MPVAASDIQWRLSGGASNSDPDASLGGVMSSVAVVEAPADNNVFDNVSGAEATAGDEEYRCIYVRNNHGSDSATNVKIAIPSQIAGGASIEIGLDPAGVGDGSSTGVATTVVDEDTAPAGVTFSAPTTDSGGLNIGTMPAGEGQAVWIKRITSAGTAAKAGDGATLRLFFD